jgi:hypothetical protein
MWNSNEEVTSRTIGRSLPKSFADHGSTRSAHKMPDMRKGNFVTSYRMPELLAAFGEVGNTCR